LLGPMAAPRFARVQAGPVALAVFNLDQEGFWVAPVLCRPPIKCAVPSEWRQKEGWPKEVALPAGFTTSIPTPSVLDALAPEDQALLCTICPQKLFLLSVPGGTLEVLKHTPGVKKAWLGEGREDALTVLCTTAAGVAAPGPPAAPDPVPLHAPAVLDQVGNSAIHCCGGAGWANRLGGLPRPAKCVALMGAGEGGRVSLRAGGGFARGQ
jgi:hypothetical protein